jgi:hypothetical protein
VKSFFFAEDTITDVIYLDLLEAFSFPQLDETESPDIVFQQDGAPPHFSNFVWASSKDKFPDRWTKRNGQQL